MSRRSPDPGADAPPVPALDPALQAQLAELRAHARPAPLARRQIWNALEAEIAGAPDPGDDPNGDPSGDPSGSAAGPDPTGTATASTVGKLSFAAKVVGATVAMTGAGLLGLRLAVVGARALLPADAPPPPPTPRSATADPTRAPTPPTPALPTSDASAPPPSPARDKPTTAAAKASQDPPHRAQDREATPTTPPLANPDTLAAEFVLIRQARNSSSPSATLETLERHRIAFPSGQLRDERERLRLEALCALGREAEARALAKGVRDDIGSARTRELCPNFALDL